MRMNYLLCAYLGVTLSWLIRMAEDTEPERKRGQDSSGGNRTTREIASIASVEGCWRIIYHNVLIWYEYLHIMIRILGLQQSLILLYLQPRKIRCFALPDRAVLCNRAQDCINRNKMLEQVKTASMYACCPCI